MREAGARDMIEVDPGRENCILDIVSVNPRNYLSNIHVRMCRDAEPNAPFGDTFNPAFLGGFRG